jgi:hypothetical protein
LSNNNKFILKLIKNLSSFSALLISLSFIQADASAQIKTNLELFYSLIDSASVSINKKIPEDDNKILLTLTFGNNYEVLKNYFISSITSDKKNISVSADQSQSVVLNITLDEARIEYPDNFKDGFFGDFYTIRKASISGSYLFSAGSILNERFSFEIIDSIRTSDLHYVENFSYPFTAAEKPSEPFFSSLFEPVVAVGTTALAVILFFTIRSK